MWNIHLTSKSHGEDWDVWRLLRTYASFIPVPPPLPPHALYHGGGGGGPQKLEYCGKEVWSIHDGHSHLGNRSHKLFDVLRNTCWHNCAPALQPTFICSASPPLHWVRLNTCSSLIKYCDIMGESHYSLVSRLYQRIPLRVWIDFFSIFIEYLVCVCVYVCVLVSPLD